MIFLTFFCIAKFQVSFSPIMTEELVHSSQPYNSVDHTYHLSTQSRTAISMFLEVNTLFMDVKVDFAIPIRPLISLLHLASEEKHFVNR